MQSILTVLVFLKANIGKGLEKSHSLKNKPDVKFVESEIGQMMFTMQNTGEAFSNIFGRILRYCADRAIILFILY
jgi:hypothetical protein